ncbi:unnamed protein product [Eruca vesicaria subsp. sativa]|uniref:RPW8 domain-containing protein n=1 Tax=Eruca vesicaria subsp. sativa TaxID=29727 RepID=A0ABC8JFM1_ERUVS|nr:unnamed protein product [Eruca vesicaria subsp. sativa]
MDIPFSSFSMILVLLITEVKKLKDFEHLFEDLVSTMEILVPITEEIDKLQEKLDPCNKSLVFLHKTISRAQEMVRECSHVWKYNIIKKYSYTKQIKAINDDFAKFSGLYMPLIQLLNQLRSLSRTGQEKCSVSTGRRSFDEDEQRVILASFKDKGKGKQLQHQEDEQLASALQESLNMEDEQVDKRRVEELQKDEQIANALLYDESERITNGSSSSIRAPFDEEDIQRMIWESFRK